MALCGCGQENPFSINGAPQKHPSESVGGVDQVDPLSGNLLLAHTDLVLPGNAGLDLRITRYYNSQITGTSPTGTTATKNVPGSASAGACISVG